jgi:hypothetical protein
MKCFTNGGFVRIAIIDGVFYEPIWMQVQPKSARSPDRKNSVPQLKTAFEKFGGEIAFHDRLSNKH